MKSLFSLVFILILTTAIGQTSLGDTNNEGYLFGVFPYLPTNRIKTVYTPVANDFEKTLGVPITMRTKSTYKDFTKSLHKEEYDIAFVQPFDYVTAYDQYNYLPLAKRSIPLRTVLIVKKDSLYEDVISLKGQTIASPPPHAAVSRIGDRLLRDVGLDPRNDVQRKYKKNHFACMQSVMIGEAEACATADRALKHFGDVKMKNKFRILEFAPEVPNSLFVVHKRVPEDQREKLRQSIIAWSSTEKGQAILQDGKIIPMIAAADSDYKLIRSIAQDK